MKKNKRINLDEISLNFSDLLNFSNENENFIKKFRNILKKRYHKKRIIFLRDARTAICESLKLMDIKKSDEVIIPAYTSKPVLTAVEKVCKPLFVDINPNDANVNPNQIAKKASNKTRAIIITHTYGKSDNMNEILEIADKRDLTIIEDLAQSPWGRYNRKNLGTYGEYSVLSFAPYKDITCFAGGAVLHSNELPEHDEAIDLIGSCKCFLWLYSSKLFECSKSIGLSKKIVSILNEKRINLERDRKCSPIRNRDEITNYMAYVLCNQIKNLNSKIKKRRENARFYLENLKSETIAQKEICLDNHTFYRFTIKVKHKEKVYNRAHHYGISCGKAYDYHLAPLPNSVKASQMNLNIPVHHNLKIKDLEKIVNFINKLV